MQTRNITLLALDAFGGKISGKTLFTKRIYFLAEILAKELGYYAHYYGPYSDEIAGNITILKNLGFIKEESHGFGLYNGAGFEVRRYDYELTGEGRNAVRWLREQRPREAKEIDEAVSRIREAGELDYIELSIAAKAYLILKQANRPLTPQDITAQAKNFSWTVDDHQIQSGVKFLEKLNLISVKKQVPTQN